MAVVVVTVVAVAVVAVAVVVVAVVVWPQAVPSIPQSPLVIRVGGAPRGRALGTSGRQGGGEEEWEGEQPV